MRVMPKGASIYENGYWIRYDKAGKQMSPHKTHIFQNPPKKEVK